jgi:hypothetical protein
MSAEGQREQDLKEIVKGNDNIVRSRVISIFRVLMGTRQVRCLRTAPVWPKARQAR